MTQLRDAASSCVARLLLPEPIKSRVPSGLKVTMCAATEWPPHVESSAPVCVLQIRTPPVCCGVAKAAATLMPSGL